MSNTPVVVAPVIVEPVVVEPTVVAPTKAPKKPSLPAKYNKFLSFGFWFISQMEPDARDALFAQMHLFSSLEEQSAFFQTYLDEASASNKIMRKTIANHNKPVKTRATKARKPSKPLAAQTDDLIATLIADANGEPTLDAPLEKPKKTRKPKSENTDDKPKKTKKTEVVTESVESIASEPVESIASEPLESIASEPLESIAQPVESLAQPVVKKTTKPKAEKAEKPKVEKPKAEKAEKPNADKPKKDKKDKKPVEELPTTDKGEEDDSIQAHIVQLNGSQYLMDFESNLYDIDSHEQIGTYNPDTNSAVIN